MIEILELIKTKGVANSRDIAKYSINVLKRKRKFANGCLARLYEYGKIEIIGICNTNGRKCNIYRPVI